MQAASGAGTGIAGLFTNYFGGSEKSNMGTSIKTKKSTQAQGTPSAGRSSKPKLKNRKGKRIISGIDDLERKRLERSTPFLKKQGIL